MIKKLHRHLTVMDSSEPLIAFNRDNFQSNAEISS
jgi:hypothetical protein